MEILIFLESFIPRIVLGEFKIVIFKGVFVKAYFFLQALIFQVFIWQDITFILVSECVKWWKSCILVNLTSFDSSFFRDFKVIL